MLLSRWCSQLRPRLGSLTGARRGVCIEQMLDCMDVSPKLQLSRIRAAAGSSFGGWGTVASMDQPLRRLWSTGVLIWLSQVLIGMLDLMSPAGDKRFDNSSKLTRQAPDGLMRLIRASHCKSVRACSCVTKTWRMAEREIKLPIPAPTPCCEVRNFKALSFSTSSSLSVFLWNFR